MMFFDVNIDDVLFWMDAIRNSKDRDRVLESFWKGQVQSKVWLIEQLRLLTRDTNSVYKIAIYGGWNGVLANLFFNSGMRIRHVTSIDIDPNCEEVASTVNKKHEMRETFRAVTADMCEYIVEDANLVVNTSCEHITQAQYEQWLSNQPEDAMIVLQSNNFDIEEHIRISKSLEEFKNLSNIDVLWEGELQLPLYTRYMLIGRKFDISFRTDLTD
jgi:hypothetical protein